MKKILLSLMLAVGFLVIPTSLLHATVTNETSQIIYNGDSVTSTFSFPFNVYNTASENDLVVSKLNTTTSAITNLTINTDYTVSLLHAVPSNGTITLLAGALPTGTTLSILRQLPLTQEVRESNNSPTPASVRNNVYDRNIMIAQQLQAQIDLAVLQNPFSTTSVTLPLAVSGQCLGWSGSDLANVACSSGGGGGGGGGSNFNPPIADSQLQAITTANKVNGSAIYSLSSLPSGAGVIPTANLPVGTTANKIVQLTAAIKYPAVDGSLITKIDGSNLLNLQNTSSLAGVIPVANLGTSSGVSTRFLNGVGAFASVTSNWVPNNIQVFTAGSSTWTKPAGVSVAYVKVWGAGGGAGGGGANKGSGGGGGAGYSEGFVTVTTDVTVIVGTGGAGGLTTTDGSDGGDSSFAGAITVSGGGGKGGKGSTSGGAGGAIGSGSTGQIVFNGSVGGAGLQSSPGTGGAGGNAFSSPGGPVTLVTGAGVDGAFPGAGGSGADGASTGGAGADGKVIVYY